MGDIFVDGLVDVGEDAQFHQIGDDLEWLLLELLGQFANDDRRFDGDNFAGCEWNELRLDWRGGFGGFLAAAVQVPCREGSRPPLRSGAACSRPRFGFGAGAGTLRR